MATQSASETGGSRTKSSTPSTIRKPPDRPKEKPPSVTSAKEMAHPYARTVPGKPSELGRKKPGADKEAQRSPTGVIRSGINGARKIGERLLGASPTRRKSLDSIASTPRRPDLVPTVPNTPVMHPIDPIRYNTTPTPHGTTHHTTENPTIDHVGVLDWVNENQSISTLGDREQEEMDLTEDPNYNPTPEEIFGGRSIDELGQNVQQALKDSINCFSMSLKTYGTHPTMGTDTKHLVDDLYRLIHGCSWAEEMVDKAVEAARYATREYSSLTDTISGLVEKINGMEDRLDARLNKVEQSIKAADTNALANPAQQQYTPNGPKNSTATGPVITPTRKTTQPAAPPQKKPANPLNAHHPSRLIVQVLPDGIKDTGTKKGIEALAEFLEKSGAFTKTGTPRCEMHIPSFEDEPDPHDTDDESDDGG
ncbi:hypothetical protein C8R45DRAFT_928764 [Mycena sanguinolenta]|nr:hypothetical protein C8R45DRAFT_928764 [Mycena sanguinolenta]